MLWTDTKVIRRCALAGTAWTCTTFVQPVDALSPTRIAASGVDAFWVSPKSALNLVLRAPLATGAKVPVDGTVGAVDGTATVSTAQNVTALRVAPVAGDAPPRLRANNQLDVVDLAVSPTALYWTSRAGLVRMPRPGP